MSRPIPTIGEDKSTFIHRCMSDIIIIKDYPDAHERLRICNSIFEDYINN